MGIHLVWYTFLTFWNLLTPWPIFIGGWHRMSKISKSAAQAVLTNHVHKFLPHFASYRNSRHNLLSGFKLSGFYPKLFLNEPLQSFRKIITTIDKTATRFSVGFEVIAKTWGWKSTKPPYFVIRTARECKTKKIANLAGCNLWWLT